MTAEEILVEIRMLGGRLEARGDRLHVEAPNGVLKPEHRNALIAFKTEILRLLQEDLDIEHRLERHGIRIAIDTKTGEACLVFSESEAEACRHVATVYKPFEREWTDDQKRELLASLRYYERLMRQKARQEETSHEIQASREKEQK